MTSHLLRRGAVAGVSALLASPLPLLLPLEEPGVADRGLLDPGRVHHPSTAAGSSLDRLIDLLPRELLFLQVDCDVLRALHQCHHICPSPIAPPHPRAHAKRDRNCLLRDGCQGLRHGLDYICKIFTSSAGLTSDLSPPAPPGSTSTSTDA